MKVSFRKSIALWSAVFLCLGLSLLAGAAEPALHAAGRVEFGSLPAASGAKLTFRRVFKSSTPEFIEITVREDSDESRPMRSASWMKIQRNSPFEVSAPLRGKMFELGRTVEPISRGRISTYTAKSPTLVRRRFAGKRAPEVHEAIFNYTLNTAAAQLLQIFEGLARQQELLMLLERRMKYDRLGINDALLQFETDLNRKLLPEPQRALPALDQIASDTRFVDIARQRARAVAERIRHSNS